MIMQLLEIKNFGPIKDVTISITDLMVFIGPQASGKSTIAKNIHYFRSIKDFLLESIEVVLNANGSKAGVSVEELWKLFQSNLRMKFAGFWGAGMHYKGFQSSFHFSQYHKVEVMLEDGRIVHKFSDSLKIQIDKIFTEVCDFINGRRDLVSEPGMEYEGNKGQVVKYHLWNKITVEIKAAFKSPQSGSFIPANRSLITTLPDYLINLILRTTLEKQDSGDHLFDPYMIDLPTKQFINLISFIKPQFTKSIDEIITEKESLIPEGIDKPSLQPFIEMIPQILKGRYLYASGSERLYLPESNDFVNINLASSGQQESIWILLHLFRLALNKTPSLVVIEEPETHLYTETQVELVNLLAHFCNINLNQLVVTTHSPYVLAAFNNLIFAHEVGRKQEEKISGIIPKRYWLDPDKVSAYFVEDGKVEDILEPDLNQIAVERIDNASRIVNQQYDQMLELLDG